MVYRRKIFALFSLFLMPTILIFSLTQSFFYESSIFAFFNRESLAVSPQNGSNPNGNIQLSVAYLGPLATLTSHLERLTPLTPADPHRVGSKFTHSQITQVKNENKSTLVQIAISISCSPRLKKNI